MIALNRTQGRAASDGGMFGFDLAEALDHPQAEATKARLRAACSPHSTIDIEEHVERVAALTLHAQKHPLTRFGRATL